MNFDTDRIIIDELKEAYRMNCLPEKIDCSDDYIEPDHELLYAIRKVLEYYMTPKEYIEWCRKLTDE